MVLGAVEELGQACTLCRSRLVRRLFPARDRLHGLPGQFWIARCVRCGLICTSPRPEGPALAVYYPGDYAPHRAADAQGAQDPIATAGRSRAWRWLRRRWITRHIWWMPELPAGARVLELGSGAGHFVRAALARGWEVNALEPAAGPAERLGLDAQVHVHREPAEALDVAPGSFDAIFAWMVVEHLEDPGAVLRKIAAALKPGRHFVFSVPNAGCWEFGVFRGRWYALDVPRHLWHFRPRTLTDLLVESGFRVERVFHQKTVKNITGSLEYIAEDFPGFGRMARSLSRAISRPEVSFAIGALLAALRQGGRLTVVARAVVGGQPPRRLRVLLHKPLVRARGLYFRSQQYVEALQRLGCVVQVLDFGRLPWFGRVLRLLGVLKQVGVSALAFTRCDVVIVTPHPLVAFYVAMARLLNRRVIMDQILTYVSHDEVWPWFPRALDAWTYRRVHGTLTHSQAMREELIRRFGLEPESVEVAYPVLDLTLFSRRYATEAQALRQELHINAAAFVVLYHGMWHPWHGMPYLYEAARLLEGRPEIMFVFMAGEGQLKRPNVLLVKEQPFETLPVYLQAADVWCSGFDTDPRGERAFSSTLIQALALGLPIVTGRTGERGDVLRDRVEARLLPLRDPTAIVEAILQVKARPEEARAMGDRARSFAEQHFSIDRLDRALSALLDRARGDNA